jgi:ankyrin repeat protein
LEELRLLIKNKDQEMSILLLNQFKSHKAEDKLRASIDEEDNTYLHIVCKRNLFLVAKALIEIGLNINAKNAV